MRTPLHGVVPQSEAVGQTGDDRLPAEDADRAGQCARLGEDLVRAAGDVVATRAGDGAHRDDDRLAGLARAGDLAPDRVGGDGRTTGGVDPEHDRPGLLVTHGGPQRRRYGVAAHQPTLQRRSSRAPGDDAAEAVDQGNARSVLLPYLTHDSRDRRRLRRPPVGEQQLYVATGRSAGGGVDLVAVADVVDQLRRKRVVGKDRRAVGQADDVIDGDSSGLRDRLGDLLPRRPGQPVERFTVRVGETGRDDAVGRALVLVALPDLRLDAQLVERAAQERDLCRDTGEVELAAGLQPLVAEAAVQEV